MWICEECKLCLISSRVGDLIRLNYSKYISKLLIKLTRILTLNSRTIAFVKSFNVIKELIKSNDPYENVKIELNKLSEEYVYKIYEEVARSNYNIIKAFKYSINANIIDTSVLDYEQKNLNEAFNDNVIFSLDLKNYLNNCKNIAIILDNCGEFLFDTLILGESLRKNNFNVTLIVRKEPYEIDVVLKDIPSEVKHKFNILEINNQYSAFLDYRIENFDLIIAKGIANLEAAYEFYNKLNVLHLLRLKCSILSKIFKLSKNTSVIVSLKAIKNTLRKL